MARPKEITKKLKVADPEIAAYVAELEKENLRLQKVVAKLQVKCLSQDNEILALRKEAKKPRGKIVIMTHSPEKRKDDRTLIRPPVVKSKKCPLTKKAFSFFVQPITSHL